MKQIFRAYAGLRGLHPAARMLILLVGLTVSVGVNASDSDGKTVARFFNSSPMPALYSYHADLLNLILEKTQADYGDYTVENRELTTASARVLRSLIKGDYVNISYISGWDSWPDYSAEELDEVVIIKTDTLYNMLGLRCLIVSEKGDAFLNNINSFREFRDLTTGQGQGWPDVKILKYNGISTVTSPRPETLFDMMFAGRFDYYPLSCLEAESVINRHRSATNNTVKLNDKHLIFYPLRMMFVISKREQVLAERVREGMAMMYRDGSMKSLFMKHFTARLEWLKANNPQVFVLYDPNLSDQENRRAVELLENQEGIADEFSEIVPVY